MTRRELRENIFKMLFRVEFHEEDEMNEDYLLNDDMSDYDRKHWQYVTQQYRDLRAKLANKKFKEKQYGLFFDYSKLDKLDNEDEE